MDEGVTLLGPNSGNLFGEDRCSFLHPVAVNATTMQVDYPSDRHPEVERVWEYELQHSYPQSLHNILKDWGYYVNNKTNGRLS